MRRILVVSEVRLYAEGVAAYLRTLPDFHVSGVATSPLDARRLTEHVGPHALLVDATNGPDALLHPTAQYCRSSTRIVAFGVADDPAAVVACVRAGAIGYVTRDTGLAGMLVAIERVLAGEVELPPSVGAEMMRALASAGSDPIAPPRAAREELTSREKEVLDELQHGLSNKSIASSLSISVSTVKNHVHNILEKLGATTRAEAVAICQGFDTEVRMDRRI